MSMITIQPYSAERDEDAVFALWQAALDQHWPLAAADFRKVIAGSPRYRAGDYFIAHQEGRIVGFAATQMNRGEPESASMPVLYIDPRCQRQGIGTALHDAALAHLREIGATAVRIGGGYTYFWPGVPDNLQAAKLFFQARGWDFTELCYDLAQPMREYRSPEGLDDIVLETTKPEDVPELLAFEAREFPHWSDSFQAIVDVRDFEDLLVARDQQSRAILGSLILFSHRSHPSRSDVVWKKLLGEPLGAIGCVGVTPAAQGRGIGSALVARGSEILKQRGVESVHIGWVDRVNFYGRLGYAKWQAFHMSWRAL